MSLFQYLCCYFAFHLCMVSELLFFFECTLREFFRLAHLHRITNISSFSSSKASKFSHFLNFILFSWVQTYMHRWLNVNIFLWVADNREYSSINHSRKGNNQSKISHMLAKDPICICLNNDMEFSSEISIETSLVSSGIGLWSSFCFTIGTHWSMSN